MQSRIIESDYFISALIHSMPIFKPAILSSSNCTFRIIATVTLAVIKMHFVKLGSPKNATDAFAMRAIRAVIATKVISRETKLEECKA